MTSKQNEITAINYARQFREDEGGGGVSTKETLTATSAIQIQNTANNDKESRLQRYSSLLAANETGHFSDGDDEDSDDDDQYEQAMDIFVKHYDNHHHNGESRLRERRTSLPTEDIELTTFSGVVMRRKQQLKMRLQQGHYKLNNDSTEQSKQQHLNLPSKPTKGNRPLSISSISSAASSGSSGSSNSSSSSGIHSSLTRNSSLNYSQEFRGNLSYLESVESLNGNVDNSDLQRQPDSKVASNEDDHTASNLIENALKNLNLLGKDSNSAQTRAAILAAGELQRRSFNIHQPSGPLTNESKLSRINRSFHASLRYDKSTAYRIHLMANARAFALSGQTKSYNLNNRNNSITSNAVESNIEPRGIFRRYSTISRNNSSTSSDSGHGGGVKLLSMCHCGVAYRERSAAASANQSSISCCSSDLLAPIPIATSSNDNKLDKLGTTTNALFDSHATTSDGSTTTTTSQKLPCIHHHPNCPSFSDNLTTDSSQRPLRSSPKLQQSPSSVSSYSNTSSLFRDDGFEDDFTSTASEHSSSVTISSGGSINQIKHYHNLRLSCVQQQQAKQLHSTQTGNNQNNRHRIHNDQELPLLSIGQRVVTEIIETERSYVDDLEQIVSGYLCRLRDVLDQHQELFSNLEDIYKFNKDFLFQLEECYLNPGSIAACFVENASKFDVYTHYCTMYPQVVSTLTELMARPATAQILKERQLELNQSLPLGAYLLKPVQRILKYHILFKSLIKHTADDETVDDKDRESINEAISVMTNIACHINEMKKRHEHSIRVQELQSLLIGWEGPDLTTLGELILEDTFKLFNRQKSTRHLLLFDNVLLITKKKRDGNLHYKGHIECSNLMLIETIEGQPLVFNTVPFDNPRALCAFQADNLDKKRDWCLQMKEVIIKSFEVKIPHHVRDLLMSFTKTGASPSATETKNSRKLSSSEKSGRVLRAPNYLDKKRAKQQQHDKINNSKRKH